MRANHFKMCYIATLIANHFWPQKHFFKPNDWTTMLSFGCKKFHLNCFPFSAYKETKKPKANANHVECSFEAQPGEDQFCKVVTDNLITGPCTSEENFGYDKGTPCIAIKLNKVRQFWNDCVFNKMTLRRHGRSKTTPFLLFGIIGSIS